MKLLPILALVSLILAACASKPKPTEQTNQARKGPQLIGRIASIPADKRFVLIQGYGKWNIESGTILTTRGTGKRSANLRVTGESLGQFAAADLQSGLVEIGDAVYSQHVPAPAPTTPPPTATPDEAPEPTDNQLPLPSETTS